MERPVQIRPAQIALQQIAAGLQIAQADGEKYQIHCVSAWNKDPIIGVIGVQTGPQ
jgi:hypothetical protein